LKKLLDANIVGLLPVPGGFFYIQQYKNLKPPKPISAAFAESQNQK
jgi:hypothetical protein